MAANAAPKQRTRGPGRPFQAGRSGNPSGKRKGTRHQTTLLAEQLMSDDVEAAVARVLKAARGGSMSAAKLILDRVVPPRKGRPLAISLPDVKTSRSLSDALAAVVAAMASGTISTDEAAAICSVLESHRRSLETTELEARLLSIEEALKSHEQEF